MIYRRMCKVLTCAKRNSHVNCIVSSWQVLNSIWHQQLCSRFIPHFNAEVLSLENKIDFGKKIFQVIASQSSCWSAANSSFGISVLQNWINSWGFVGLQVPTTHTQVSAISVSAQAVHLANSATELVLMHQVVTA